MSTHQDDIVCARYMAGESANQVARALCLDSTTVRRILKRRGVHMRTAEEYHANAKACTPQRCAELLAQGHSIEAIARELNVDAKTVRARLDAVTPVFRVPWNPPPGARAGAFFGGGR